jgi:hypothetical protein
VGLSYRALYWRYHSGNSVSGCSEKELIGANISSPRKPVKENPFLQIRKKFEVRPLGDAKFLEADFFNEIGLLLCKYPLTHFTPSQITLEINILKVRVRYG